MEFLIMNGAGNRFAVFDGWPDVDGRGLELTDAQVRAVAEPGGRWMGELGADQVVTVRPPKTPGADVFMEIRNRDGSHAGACGNATRCVAWLWMREEGTDACVVETVSGLLPSVRTGEHEVRVDMGAPKLDWRDIPLKEPMHTHHIDVKIGPIDNPVLSNPGAVSMGNPHCVFFVEDFTTAKPELVGPMVEYFPLFPEQANVGFARVDARDRIRLKVWERGVGMTEACGSGACAAVVAGVRQSRCDREADVELDGGNLRIRWDAETDHVFMTGPVELEGEAVFTD